MDKNCETIHHIDRACEYKCKKCGDINPCEKLKRVMINLYLDHYYCPECDELLGEW